MSKDKNLLPPKGKGVNSAHPDYENQSNTANALPISPVENQQHAQWHAILNMAHQNFLQVLAAQQIGDQQDAQWHAVLFDIHQNFLQVLAAPPLEDQQHAQWHAVLLTIYQSFIQVSAAQQRAVIAAQQNLAAQQMAVIAAQQALAAKEALVAQQALAIQEAIDEASKPSAKKAKIEGEALRESSQLPLKAVDIQRLEKSQPALPLSTSILAWGTDIEQQTVSGAPEAMDHSYTEISERETLIKIYKKHISDNAQLENLSNNYLCYKILKYIDKHIDLPNQNSNIVRYVISVQLKELYKKYIPTALPEHLTIEKMIKELMKALNEGECSLEKDWIINNLLGLVSHFDIELVDCNLEEEDLANYFSDEDDYYYQEEPISVLAAAPDNHEEAPIAVVCSGEFLPHESATH